MLINLESFICVINLRRRFVKILNAPFQSYVHLKSLIYVCDFNLRRCAALPTLGFDLTVSVTLTHIL